MLAVDEPPSTATPCTDRMGWPGLALLDASDSRVKRYERRRGHAGSVCDSQRDLAWDAMVAVAERMERSYDLQGLRISASRRRSWRRWQVIEGLSASDLWTDVFEPVRYRRILGSSFCELQTVSAAAASVGEFLRRRPDLRSS